MSVSLEFVGVDEYIYEHIHILYLSSNFGVANYKAYFLECQSNVRASCISYPPLMFYRGLLF